MNQTYQEAEIALAEPKPLKINNVFSKVSKDLEYAHISRYILSAANQLQNTAAHASSNQEIKPEKDKKVDDVLVAASPIDTQKTRKFGMRRESERKAFGVQHSFQPSHQSNTAVASTKTGGASMRSTSTKPQTGAEGGSNATTKASYMQATSSWAKKKSQIIKDKEEFNGKKNEQRKNFQNARGFTTLGHSSSTTQNFNS